MIMDKLCKKTQRSSLPILTDEHILALYKEVLLFCESEAINRLKNKCITNNPFKEQTNNIVKFEYNISNSEIFERLGKKQNDPYIIKSSVDPLTLSNQLYFPVSGGNKLQALIKHIRNAFAHNNIFYDDAFIVLCDYRSGKNGIKYNEPTLYARLTPENLELVITAIKSMCNNNQSNDEKN